MNNHLQIEALQRARSNISEYNYQTIKAGFAEKGVSPDDIKPRENVYTLRAWGALKRKVKKGEHGIKIKAWFDKTVETDNGPVKQKIVTYPTVFHVSQTESR